MPSLTVAADLGRLEEAQAFLAEQLAAMGSTEAVARKAALVTEELFVNIASYAYGNDAGEVTISCRLEDDGVHLEFIDSGMPFDLTVAPRPDITLPAGSREAGGLGILLTRQMAQELRYQYADGKNRTEILII